MRICRHDLRLPLTIVAVGAIAIATAGLQLVTPGSAPFRLTVGELLGMSLPLTVAWFAFGGSCMLVEERDGITGLLAAGSRFAGQAACLAGIPVWAYWYLHLVFGVL